MSSQELKKCIQDGKIKIAYYAISFSSDEAKKVGHRRDVVLELDTNDVRSDESPSDEAIRDYFLDSLKGDSIYFHVGPYAQVSFITNSRRRQNRVGQTNIVNLEKLKYLTVAPGETIVVGTNEYIELSEDVGASIYATVGKTDIGFSHISTLIDPLWKGVLQISLTNLSRRPQKLKYLDTFCSVRFHYLAGEIDPNWQRRKSWKHFANNYFEENEKPKIRPSIEDTEFFNVWRDLYLTRDE